MNTSSTHRPIVDPIQARCDQLLNLTLAQVSAVATALELDPFDVLRKAHAYLAEHDKSPESLGGEPGGGAGMSQPLALHISVAAELARAPEADLRRAIAVSQLAADVVDRRTYIPLEELLRYIRQQPESAEPGPDADRRAPALTTAKVAQELHCSPEFVRKNAKKHGLGYYIGGRNGFMFTDADLDQFRAILAPKPPGAARRRRRRMSR